MPYETILYEEDGPVGTLTLNRPDDGNMFTPLMCHEVRDCINAIRRETRTRVLVLTGAGDKFFCIGVNVKLGNMPTARRDQHVMHELHSLQTGSFRRGFFFVQTGDRRGIVGTVFPRSIFVADVVFNHPMRIVKQQTLHHVMRLRFPIGD